MSSPSLQLFPTSTHWHWDLWVPRTIISLRTSSSLQLIRTSTHWHSNLWVPRTSTLFSLEHVTRCLPYSNAKGNIVWRNTQPQGMKRVSMTKQIQAPMTYEFRKKWCPPYSNAKGNIVWRNTQPQGMKRVSMTKQIQAPKSINDQQLISLLCYWDVQKCPK